MPRPPVDSDRPVPWDALTKRVGKARMKKLEALFDQAERNAMVENVRFTRVYRRAGNGWQMIAGQGTRVTDVPPPPTKG